jgi:hypothetical protein
MIEVAGHAMDDACAFSEFYLGQKLCRVRVAVHKALEGIA